MTNDFSQLDAQSAESAFAKFTPEEHAEYCAWIDARDSAGDITPEHVDGSATIAHATVDAMASAFEFGFRCAERGMNLQAANALFHNTVNH